MRGLLFSHLHLGFPTASTKDVVIQSTLFCFLCYFTLGLGVGKNFLFMKTIHFLLASLLVVAVSSCNSNTKTITPTETEFTAGELAKYVKVVDEPAELIYDEKDGAIPAQYIRLKVKLELIRDGFKDVDPQDIDFTGLLSIAMINLIDENGTKTQDISFKHDEKMKLTRLLTGSKGDVAEINFEGEFHNSQDAPKWFKETSQFTPYLAGDIQISR